MFKQCLAAAALCAASLHAFAADDLVRLGNLKFAHYGAVSYMKVIGPKYGLKIEERMFAKGVDIMPAIVAGQIDVSASALDAAIAGRAQGAPIYAVAGFAKGGVRLVAKKGESITKVADLKGGGEAVEERARAELGMVKSGETFYRVIDRAPAAAPAAPSADSHGPAP